MFWLIGYDSTTGQINRFISRSGSPPGLTDLGLVSAGEGVLGLEDPPFDLSRNHRLLFDGSGNVIGTEATINPIQPVPPPQTERELALDRAITAIKANATQTPWGKLLFDLAVSQGWVEPE